MAPTLTLRFDLRGSSLISTHLFKVLNLLKEDEDNGHMVYYVITNMQTWELNIMVQAEQYAACNHRMCATEACLCADSRVSCQDQLDKSEEPAALDHPPSFLPWFP